MSYPLHQKFIASIIALSILLTAGAAAPVRADSNDVGKALATILGIAIVGAVIKDAIDDDKPRVAPKHVKKHPHVTHPHVRKHPHVQPRPLPHRVNRKLLPQRCLRTFQVDRGRMSAFGRRCLERHYDYAHHLPNRCLREVYTDRGWRYAYGARCLSRQGFQLARH